MTFSATTSGVFLRDSLMVIDSSAVLAILLGEPDAFALATAVANDHVRLISAVSVFESSIVIETRKGPGGGKELDNLLEQAGITTISMNADQVRLSREAYTRFGKGRHPAALNLGDCCSYALARERDQPLLFKGTDFSQTDIRIVRY